MDAFTINRAVVSMKANRITMNTNKQMHIIMNSKQGGTKSTERLRLQARNQLSAFRFHGRLKTLHHRTCSSDEFELVWGVLYKLM